MYLLLCTLYVGNRYLLTKLVYKDSIRWQLLSLNKVITRQISDSCLTVAYWSQLEVFGWSFTRECVLLILLLLLLLLRFTVIVLDTNKVATLYYYCYC